jgi:hypothetical protein
MAYFREMTDEDELLLSQLVEQGLEFMEVRNRMPQCRFHELKSAFIQQRRSARSGKLRPIPEDFAERIKFVQSQWSEREWGQRWVGRYAQRQDTDIHQAASRMLQ